MSGISRLTTLGAAGAGGGGGFIISRSYDASNSFSHSVVCEDSSGNIITAGIDAYYKDIVIFKTDADGAEIWSKSISIGSHTTNAPWYKRVHDITVDSSDNIIIVGQSDRDGNLSSYRGELYIIKLNSSGVYQWAHEHASGGFGEWYTGVVVDSSDNIYTVATYNDYQNSYLYSGYVRKYNSSGTTQWRYRIYDSGDYLYANGIVIDSNDNLYISGHKQDPNQSDRYRPLIVKINSSGTQQFDILLEDTATVNFYSGGIAIDSSDNIYINGTKSATLLFVKKLNSSGVIQWQKELTVSSLAQSSEGYPSNMAIDSSQNTYFVYRNSGIVSFDASGNLNWATIVTDPDALNTHVLYNCKVTSNDELLIGGRIASSTASEIKLTTFKLPSDGVADGTYGEFEFTSFTNTPATSTRTAADTGVLTGSNGNNQDRSYSEAITTETITDDITNL